MAKLEVGMQRAVLWLGSCREHYLSPDYAHYQYGPEHMIELHSSTGRISLGAFDTGSMRNHPFKVINSGDRGLSWALILFFLGI